MSFPSSSNSFIRRGISANRFKSATNLVVIGTISHSLSLRYKSITSCIHFAGLEIIFLQLYVPTG